MTYSVFTYDGGEPFLWKDCEMGGCPNQVNHKIGQGRFCYPHSKGDKTVDGIINENKLETVT